MLLFFLGDDNLVVHLFSNDCPPDLALFWSRADESGSVGEEQMMTRRLHARHLFFLFWPYYRWIVHSMKTSLDVKMKKTGFIWIYKCTSQMWLPVLRWNQLYIPCHITWFLHGVTVHCSFWTGPGKQRTIHILSECKENVLHLFHWVFATCDALMETIWCGY